jgi:hypothetical protein
MWVPDSLDRLTILPGPSRRCRLVNEAGFLAVVVTNQSGVARGLFDETFLQPFTVIWPALRRPGGPHRRLLLLPHHPTAGKGTYLKHATAESPNRGCSFRQPGTGASTWSDPAPSAICQGCPCGQRREERGSLSERLRLDGCWRGSPRFCGGRCPDGRPGFLGQSGRMP